MPHHLSKVEGVHIVKEVAHVRSAEDPHLMSFFRVLLRLSDNELEGVG